MEHQRAEPPLEQRPRMGCLTLTLFALASSKIKGTMCLSEPSRPPPATPLSDDAANDKLRGRRICRRTSFVYCVARLHYYLAPKLPAVSCHETYILSPYSLSTSISIFMHFPSNYSGPCKNDNFDIFHRREKISVKESLYNQHIFLRHQAGQFIILRFLFLVTKHIFK